MAITSRFYHKNILRRAEDGLGDGTIYATATSTVPNQDDKQFTLNGLSILADLGVDADDLFNSMVLYFPGTETRYHIIDWDKDADMATVWETPQEDDTGSCEMRLNLRENLSTGPVHRLTDGRLNTLWIASAANQAQTMQVLLPNFIEDGGFEAQSAGNVASPWTAQTTQWQVSATSPLLGSRMAVYTQSAADCYLKQDLLDSIERGKTYRIMVHAQALTATSPGDVISIKVRQKLSPNKVIDSGMDWRPALTTSAAWFETSFEADFSSDMLELYIDALGSSGSWGSCTGFRLDEIYVYEDVSADRLIVANHNWNNGEITSLYGCRCWPGRTSFAYGDDASANLTANADIDGMETIIRSFSLSSYPIWELKLTAATGIAYQAGILFLGPQMAFAKQMDQPFDPESETSAGEWNENPAGRRVYHKDYHRGGPYDITLTNVDSVFHANLRDWWREVGRDRFPFFFCFDESISPEDIRLVRNDSDWLFPYDPVRRQGRITLTEEV